MFRLFADIGLCHDNDHMILGIAHHTIPPRRLCYQLLDKNLKKGKNILISYVYEQTN